MHNVGSKNFGLCKLTTVSEHKQQSTDVSNGKQSQRETVNKIANEFIFQNWKNAHQMDKKSS